MKNMSLYIVTMHVGVEEDSASKIVVPVKKY